MSWTDELRAECRRMFIVEGLSASETARRLNRSEAGIRAGAAFSRNAIIGVSFRAGWGRSPEIARQNIARRSPRPARVEVGPGHFRTPREPKPKPPKPISGPTQPPRAGIIISAFAMTPTARHWLTRVSGECRWPVGEPETPAEQMSCCAPSGIEHYCPGHARLGHQPQGKSRPSSVDDLARLARRYA